MGLDWDWESGTGTPTGTWMPSIAHSHSRLPFRLESLPAPSTVSNASSPELCLQPALLHPHPHPHPPAELLDY